MSTSLVKRQKSRRSVAALAFLSNISLDGSYSDTNLSIFNRCNDVQVDGNVCKPAEQNEVLVGPVSVDSQQRNTTDPDPGVGKEHADIICENEVGHSAEFYVIGSDDDSLPVFSTCEFELTKAVKCTRYVNQMANPEIE